MTGAYQRGTQPLTALGVAVSILLAVAGAVAVVGAVGLFNRVGVFADYDAGDATLVATGTVWIVWQYRYASNAEKLRGRFSLGPAWAIAGWFIPLSNLVLPYLQMNQAAKASDPVQRRSPGILLAWAFAYDTAFVISIIARILRGSPEDYTAITRTVTALLQAQLR